MTTTEERRMMDAAIKADLNARRYVLIEKLQNNPTYEEFIQLFNRLDAVEHRLQCINKRIELHSSQMERSRVTYLSLERSLAITKR